MQGRVVYIGRKIAACAGHMHVIMHADCTTTLYEAQCFNNELGKNHRLFCHFSQQMIRASFCAKEMYIYVHVNVYHLISKRRQKRTIYLVESAMMTHRY